MRFFEQPWPEGEYRFFQLGFVVNDLLSAAAAWACVVGVGPFHVLPPIEQSCVYRGTASAINIQVAVSQAGPVQIELIKQHCHRPSVFRDWGTGNVSGLHQLCTVTADYEGRKAHYERLGYEVAAEIDMGGYRVAYIDTAADFGFYTEVVGQNPQLLGLLANISETCAHWDGTDPVRVLTRDGYRVPQ